MNGRSDEFRGDGWNWGGGVAATRPPCVLAAPQETLAVAERGREQTAVATGRFWGPALAAPVMGTRTDLSGRQTVFDSWELTLTFLYLVDEEGCP